MFDAEYYGRLARLKLAVDKKSNAALLGSRKSVRKGSSAEFSDFREYMPGDDIRSIDWNAYARLDRLYIKEYMEEKESSVSMFLDFSRSMDFGEKKKSELCLELAAALSYIALMNMDHVTVYDLADVNRRHAASGGKAGYRDLSAWLERQECGEAADIVRSVQSLGRMQPGLSVIFSDFLSEEFIEREDTLAKVIKYLHFKKQKVVLVQILAAEEMEIGLSGTYYLIDSENTDSRLRVTMDAESIRSYQDSLAAFTGGLRHTAKKLGAAYHLCNTGERFDKIVFEELRDIYEF
ncbi:MAG: DUF58 domain-containing protein [Lachnospiraceae bacterium]|nr:DUF58 domain-containing protein [Lachnospiraceae bacterium]